MANRKVSLFWQCNWQLQLTMPSANCNRNRTDTKNNQAKVLAWPSSPVSFPFFINEQLESNMAVLKRRTRPRTWLRQRAQAKYGWLIPLFALEWGWRWLAYLLSGWAFLEVLEYFGTLSLLVAAVSYFGESKDRMKQKHYQAWHVINSAQGKGGSGGRIDRLRNFIVTPSHW